MKQITFSISCRTCEMFSAIITLKMERRYFGQNLLGRLRDLHYIFAVTSWSPVAECKVLMLDGNTEHIGPFRRKNIRSVTVLDLTKNLQLIKLEILLRTCAPISELPSYISIMLLTICMSVCLFASLSLCLLP